MPTIKRLIDQVEFEAVHGSIEKYYNSGKNAQFEKLYEQLRSLTPTKNQEGMTLYVYV